MAEISPIFRLKFDWARTLEGPAKEDPEYQAVVFSADNGLTRTFKRSQLQDWLENKDGCDPGILGLSWDDIEVATFLTDYEILTAPDELHYAPMQ